MKRLSLITALSALIISLLISSCNSLDCTEGTGDIEERRLSLEDIHSIRLDVSAEVILTQGPEQDIVIVGQPNILDKLERDSRTSDGVWIVDLEGCTTNFDLQIFMTIATLEEITIDGSGTFSATNSFTDLDNINLNINGSGKINLDLDVTGSTSIDIDGSGEITLIGSSPEATINIDGSSKIRNKEYECANVVIKVDGSANCEVSAQENLDATINGSGNICYVGNPVITQNIDGSGTVRPCP